jgi:hypothetical protein
VIGNCYLRLDRQSESGPSRSGEPRLAGKCRDRQAFQGPAPARR